MAEAESRVWHARREFEVKEVAPADEFVDAVFDIMRQLEQKRLSVACSTFIGQHEVSSSIEDNRLTSP